MQLWIVSICELKRFITSVIWKIVICFVYFIYSELYINIAEDGRDSPFELELDFVNKEVRRPMPNNTFLYLGFLVEVQ